LKFEAGEAPDQEAKQVDILEVLNYRRALGVRKTNSPIVPSISTFFSKCTVFFWTACAGGTKGEDFVAQDDGDLGYAQFPGCF